MRGYRAQARRFTATANRSRARQDNHARTHVRDVVQLEPVIDRSPVARQMTGLISEQSPRARAKIAEKESKSANRSASDSEQILASAE